MEMGRQRELIEAQAENGIMPPSRQINVSGYVYSEKEPDVDWQPLRNPDADQLVYAQGHCIGLLTRDGRYIHKFLNQIVCEEYPEEYPDESINAATGQ
jgi:hypothetical protein